MTSAVTASGPAPCGETAEPRRRQPRRRYCGFLPPPHSLPSAYRPLKYFVTPRRYRRLQAEAPQLARSPLVCVTAPLGSRKRAYTGTFHVMIWKHLQRYADALSRGQGLRDLGTFEVMSAAVNGMWETADIRRVGRVDSSGTFEQRSCVGAPGSLCLGETTWGGGKELALRMFKGHCSHLTTTFQNAPHPRPRQARTPVRSGTVVVRNPLGGTLVDIICIIERSRQERQRLLFLQTVLCETRSDSEGGGLGPYSR